MGTPINVLVVEDSPDDALIILDKLTKAGFDPVHKRVETIEGMRAALLEKAWDIVLSDYSLPGFSGLEALRILRETGLDLPFILISGAIGEETAVEVMRSGAHDYVMKNNLARLVPSIRRELLEARVRADKRKAETDLKESTVRWFTTFDAIEESVCLLNEEGIILQCNKAYLLLTGQPMEEVIGQECCWMAYSAEALGEACPFKRLEVSKSHEEAEVLIDEKWLSISVDPVLDDAGRLQGVVHIIRDITKRKVVEEAILRSKKLLQNVIDSTPDWIYVKDLEHRYVMVNKSFAGALGIAPKEIVGRSDAGFWPGESVFGDRTKGTRGYRDDDRDAFLGQFVHNPNEVVQAPDGTLRVFDTFKIPLGKPPDGIYGVLCYSRDITDKKKAEDELKRSYEKLERILNEIVESIGEIVEQRDPYTAGHQSRVTKLACALAREMGLAADRVDKIRIGALLHDIGKIAVPAEILAKPGKLSDIEFNLIKQHSEAGYNIVKNIDFPPEVAEMILQHHERLDGSGYPRRLRADEIILEGRILAVSDVIEAMSSHRPYRPTLGMGPTLEHMIGNKGILYDPEVVDAGVRLIREKGFKFD